MTGLGAGEAGPRDVPTPSTVVSSMFMSKQATQVRKYRVVVNGTGLGPPCDENLTTSVELSSTILQLKCFLVTASVGPQWPCRASRG